MINIGLIYLNDSHQLNSFKNEVFYLFKNGKPAWITGLAISNITIALYFFIPSISKVDRFDASFGIFLGILAIFLGIHILYEKDAPLIGTSSLLEKLHKDLNTFKGDKIYFVFPALNLGFYTEAIFKNKNVFGPQNAPNNENIFYNDIGSSVKDFYDDLEKITKKSKSNHVFKAIIYDDDDNDDNNYIKKFYMTYHYMISKEDECQSLIINKEKENIKDNINALNNDQSVEKCVESARFFNKLFQLTKVKPNELIQPVIVIDKIVYLIADYGMPIYDETDKYFVPLKKEGRPVELICWRRTDAALANAITNHIDKFIETKNNNINTTS